MTSETKLRSILPISQSLLAATFGSWGEWARITSLNNSWLGWNSSERFHTWPWPLKFAVIQNMPAFLVGLFLSWPLGSSMPGLPEWVQQLPTLLLVPVLWYFIAIWLERDQALQPSDHRSAYWPWVLVCFVTLVSLLGALSSGRLFGSYTTFIPFGVVYWLALGIAMALLARHRKRIQSST